jgi:hypothetical protein
VLTEISRNFRRYSNNSADSSVLGVPSNYEFKEREINPNIIRQCLDKATSDPISYLHANLGSLNKLSEIVRRDVLSAASRIGYRFVLKTVKIDEHAHTNSDGSITLNLEQYWINEGTAPCYYHYNISHMLINQSGKTIYEQRLTPSPATVAWTPARPVYIKETLILPASLSDGEYDLHLCMFNAEQPGERIALGIGGSDKERRYFIAKMDVQTEPSGRKNIRIR